jgi:hypothetical protein
MNLDKQRYYVPLDSKVQAARRALVNEMGFQMFRLSLGNGSSLDQTRYTTEELTQIYLQAWKSLQMSHWFRGSDASQPDEIERGEIVDIARRLRHFFRKQHSGKALQLSLVFPGCGFVDDSEGDVLVEQTLYEIKAGDRSFRLADVRQVLVYLAMNQSANCYNINKVGFLNPRLGVCYSLDVEELVHRVAGKSSVELLSDIVYFVSSSGVSR